MSAPHAESLSCLCSFAGAQIRNTASVGGNIVTGSPISDVNPLYMAMGATFTVEGKGTEPRQIAANDFFLGYRCAYPVGIVCPACCWLVCWLTEPMRCCATSLVACQVATQYVAPFRVRRYMLRPPCLCSLTRHMRRALQEGGPEAA